jgi:hypothetical protein
MNTLPSRYTLAGLVSALLAAPGAQAADSAAKQVVKPPVAQAWLDVATFSGLPMGGGMGEGMMNATLGSLMGGKSGKAEFGNTQVGVAGRWMDVTLYTSRNPSLAEALQAVPTGTQLAPTLQLQAPEKPKPLPVEKGEDDPDDWDYEPPKGKLIMYWGCSETVRAGQPKIVNLETATLGELAKFFESRRATQRGAHAAVGRPVWPSRTDKRALPANASLAGAHAFTGSGVPESFKFTIPPAQDLMPEFNVRQTDKGSHVLLEWNAMPTARAYFLGTMGGREGEEATMVLWTSSELPDSGFGLFDYQTNKAVDKWLGQKVLLPPSTTRCAVPKDAAGQGMLRAIAYGSELNMAYPPRPTDPKVAWEPDWNIKIRVKSMSTSVIGMDGSGMGGMDAAGEQDEIGDAPAPDAEAGAPPAGEEPKKKKKFSAFDALKEVAKEVVP